MKRSWSATTTRRSKQEAAGRHTPCPTGRDIVPLHPIREHGLTVLRPLLHQDKTPEGDGFTAGLSENSPWLCSPREACASLHLGHQQSWARSNNKARRFQHNIPGAAALALGKGPGLMAPTTASAGPPGVPRPPACAESNAASRQHKMAPAMTRGAPHTWLQPAFVHASRLSGQVHAFIKTCLGETHSPRVRILTSAGLF